MGTSTTYLFELAIRNLMAVENVQFAAFSRRPTGIAGSRAANRRLVRRPRARAHWWRMWSYPASAAARPSNGRRPTAVTTRESPTYKKPRPILPRNTPPLHKTLCKMLCRERERQRHRRQRGREGETGRPSQTGREVERVWGRAGHRSCRVTGVTDSDVASVAPSVWITFHHSSS